MAIITKGITGGISGKLSQVIGSNYNGKSIIQSLSKSKPKVPKNELPQNGKNLLTIADTYKICKDGINQMLKAYRPDAILDWNTIIKQTITNSELTRAGLVSPMSLGVSELPDTSFFRSIITSPVSFCGIQIDNINGVRLHYPNLRFARIGFDSQIGLFGKTLFFSPNNGSETNVGAFDYPVGNYQIVGYFLEDLDTGKVGKLGLAMRVVS